MISTSIAPRSARRAQKRPFFAFRSPQWPRDRDTWQAGVADRADLQ